MSGNAKQRRKARRAAARSGIAPAPRPPGATYVPAEPYLTAEQIVACALPERRWPWLVGGIVAVVVMLLSFIAWIYTLPVRPR